MRYESRSIKNSSMFEVIDLLSDGGEGQPLIVASFFDQGVCERFVEWANGYDTLNQRFADATDSFNMALKALDRNDERRSREYSKFIEDRTGEVASQIAIRRIFDIVYGAFSGRLCNYTEAVDGFGGAVPMTKVIADAQEQAKEELFKVAGVDADA